LFGLGLGLGLGLRPENAGLGLGLGLETSGLGLGLGLEASGLGLGLGLVPPGLVNITDDSEKKTCHQKIANLPTLPLNCSCATLASTNN